MVFFHELSLAYTIDWKYHQSSNTSNKLFTFAVLSKRYSNRWYQGWSFSFLQLAWWKLRTSTTRRIYHKLSQRNKIKFSERLLLHILIIKIKVIESRERLILSTVLVMLQSTQVVWVQHIKEVPVEKSSDVLKEYILPFNCLTNTLMIKGCKSKHLYKVDNCKTRHHPLLHIVRPTTSSL